jgi:glycosidase
MPAPLSASHFHVSLASQQRYGFAESELAIDAHKARLIAQTVNEIRKNATPAPGAAPGVAPPESVRAGEVNAVGLIHDVLHFIVGLYRESVDPAALEKALAFLEQRLGGATLDEALSRFLGQFPPRRPQAESSPERERHLEELLLLRLANDNPAFAPLVELFDDARLEAETEYPRVIEALGEFFRSLPGFGPDGQDLLALLESPMRASPRSLAGQLAYIRSRWGHLLGELLMRLLTGMDIISEEEKLRFAGFAPAPPEVYEYAGEAAEREAFSADMDWMTRAVMIAKNALVWLDQLSKQYGREIRTLGEIPDEELDRLARAGFTALWLIGVWERSPASREIKRRMGNPEAEASAYSLYDYTVAGELGGEQALTGLAARARARGIRLASDMVPNHTGIDSRWMIEHPERFLAYPQPFPPFPSYSFNGPNLSGASGIGISIDDHYWEKTDAAVVFKRLDFATGETRYIYHGNDGTHMPWNDTAQLDFLRPETREAVVQAVLRVAKLFPIIRFDAAMTLTKKHFQRLWYPEPGRGGDIASRAGNGLSRHDFDKAMPAEFWREVVDRVAREAPDTLLLAEAFWLLEGFFVRTLGMHRVYNSAFMNMLKAEDNASYRQVMKNTLEFDPEVLKRFVNFMSNPDEETAIAQFGDGDKYIGACVLMATLPGLPMFAHGQIEGFREKYGMEFRRAYWNETPRPDLLARHEREIFPLLRRRALFAGVEGFLLYDLEASSGGVNEDVFAYSNARGGERALVLYNNRFAHASGRIRASAAFAVKSVGGKSLARRSLAEGLGLPHDRAAFVVFREHFSGLQFLRSCVDIAESGLAVELGAYQCEVFLDFSIVTDDSTGRWARLAVELGGRGVPRVDEALREMELRPILEPLRALTSGDLWERFTRAARPECLADDEKSFVIRVSETYRAFLAAAGERLGGHAGEPAATSAAEPAGEPLSLLASCIALVRSAAPGSARPTWLDKASATLLDAGLRGEPAFLPALWLWTLLEPLGDRIDDWMLAPLIRDVFGRAGAEPAIVEDAPGLIAFLLKRAGWVARSGAAADLLSDEAFRHAVHVNSFEGVSWLRKESLRPLLPALFATGIMRLSRDDEMSRKAKRAAISRARKEVLRMREAAEASGYRWEAFRAALV